MKNPAPAGLFVFGAVRAVCRMAAAPYPAYGVARCRTGDWFVGPISGAPSGNGMLHDSTLGADFVGLISEAPSGNGILHDSTLGAGFVGPISGAPSGNGMLHDSTLGAGFVGPISGAPSGNGMLHNSTLGAGFVGPISEAPSGNGMLHNSRLGAGFVGPISGAPSGNGPGLWPLSKRKNSSGISRGKDYSAQAPRPSGRCLRQRSLAMLESNLSRSFSSFPERRI
ncbi:hypothetical protein EDP2_1285 [Enterobacter cloacae S611]|uniref:Uncharacterized protein n=1 Tax=Enterobacter cloacae S611 TaxID=1399146 RepID=A0ABP2ZU65_ENTCL|nr:hypothetical protein EDP2_1285 [Enterobacter cloacae S611]